MCNQQNCGHDHHCVACGVGLDAASPGVFDGRDDDNWCFACFEAESQRSVREDTTGPYMRSRLPKYSFRPSEWAANGY